MDQLNLEKKGIPTLTIATTPFEAPAKTVAQDLGVTDFSLVVVDHPIAGYGDGEIKDKVAKEFDKIYTAAISWKPK